MRFFHDKKNIASVLFAAAIIVLLANIIFGNFIEDENFTEEPVELSEVEIDKKFKEALYHFGIKEDWIKENKKGSAKINYAVTIPGDLPVTLILNEIFNAYQPGSADFISREKVINGKSFLEIHSGGEAKLSAEFSYNKNLVRKAGSAAFILEDIMDLNEERLSGILSTTEAFAAVVTPSAKAKILSRKISAGSKEYIVFIGDNITEINYKISDKYSVPRLKNSVRAIVGDFSSALFFMYDEGSSLYESTAFNFVREQLNKRNIRMVPQKSLTRLEGDERDELINEFRSRMFSAKEEEPVLFLISAEDFLKLGEEIVKFRKIGYKFINPSLALK